MKKLPLFLLILFCISFSCSAQEKEEKERKNIVKLNLSSFLLKAGCVQYERLLGNKFSLTGNVIYRPKSTFSPAFTEGEWQFIQMQYGSYSFTPAMRYYYGKEKKHRAFIMNYMCDTGGINLLLYMCQAVVRMGLLPCPRSICLLLG